MAIQGGPEDGVPVRVDRTGSDPGPQPGTGLRERGIRRMSATDVADAPAPDLRGVLAERMAPAERHARLLDRFITRYADDTGSRTTDKSVRKVAAATVSLFESDKKAQDLFTPYLAPTVVTSRAALPGKLYTRRHEGVSTVRDFSRALGARAEGRLEHFRHVIQADPNLLKTKMGMFSRSTREQRQKMRSIAAGLLLCGFNRNSVAYAMKAMRAAINKSGAFDADLNTAYETIARFIKSGGANDYPDFIFCAANDLSQAQNILVRMGKASVPKEPVPDLLRGVIEDSQPWPEEVGNAAPAAGTISREQIDELKAGAANVNSGNVGQEEKYVEVQQWALCGKHAANAYLHGNVITEKSLADFLKLYEFWNNPARKTIANTSAIDPSEGNDAGKIANYLNWLNSQHRLGEDQKPLVSETYYTGAVEQLRRNFPTDSHIMHASGHIVAFHRQEDGSFRLYDSFGGNLLDRLPKKDPLRYAESKLASNSVGILRPAKDAAEVRREFAHVMTIEKIQHLKSNTRTLLENFLLRITDPGRQFDEKDKTKNDEKRTQSFDQLSQKFPKLWALAQRVEGMGPDMRSMADERDAMRKLVDDAADEILPMDRPDQIRLKMLVVDDYTAAHARQDYAEHVVLQRYPWLSQQQVEPIATAIEKELENDAKRQPPSWPEDHALDPDDCAALDRMVLSMANRMFGPPPQVVPPPQGQQAPPPPAAAGAPPVHDYTVPDHDSDDEKRP
jgi:hypothetical protein